MAVDNCIFQLVCAKNMIKKKNDRFIDARDVTMNIADNLYNNLYITCSTKQNSTTVEYNGSADKVFDFKLFLLY